MTEKSSKTSLDTIQHQSFDPVAFSHRLNEVLEKSKPVIEDIIKRWQTTDINEAALDPFHIRKALMDYWFYWLNQPEKLAEMQMEYWSNWLEIAQNTASKFLGDSSAAPVIAPEKGDRRFRDPAWQENVIFDFLKQSYLLTGKWMHQTLTATDNLPANEKQRLEFAMRQFIDAIAPNNFALTNPEVLRTTLESGGDNLIKGLENLLEDFQRGDGVLKISKTNYKAFEVGKNLATTEGEVVFRNDMFELIQYTPTTAKVDKTPLLIIPPWINKYYILDMKPENSFVRFAVEQGLTVFMVSWVNPDAKLAQKGFIEYMKEGLLTALEQTLKITGEKQAHLVGYCIGGTLLTTTLAYLAANKKDASVKSATFLTTLVDFADAGELTLFTDDEQLEMLDKDMSQKGYLEASSLQNTFSLLRANDLVWSFVVNNYLLGKEPFPFDLLYWNDDSTNMPAKMHSWYLHNMYQKNMLAKPNALQVDDTAIDVTKIKTPAYFLSTREDHIAPWKATFDGAKLFGGDVTFTLAASGHVAGVVNAPQANKYMFWTAHDTKRKADDWLKDAKEQAGSWWPHWRTWLKSLDKNEVTARTPDKKASLGAAPGSYVRKKVV